MAFSKATLTFLKQLAQNNEREWFNENKQRYEQQVRTPALNFIESMASPLQKLSDCVTAEAKKVGGSLMRPYRDTRFAKDAPPIKTNIGIQFRHRLGKDVHAPGWYVHIEPGQCFLGAGVWRPDSASLRQIRRSIDQDGKQWAGILKRAGLVRDWELGGESLSRPPQGFSKDHPYLELLKYKDHILLHKFSDKQVYAEDFETYVLKRFKSSLPYMIQLCQALGVPF